MGEEDHSLSRMHSEFHSDESDSDTSSGAPEEGETVHDETRFWEDIDPSNPIGYVRDPQRLITYLIPFPKPTLVKGDTSTMPERFLIYTPPPPCLLRPDEGVHEHTLHKAHRKWQQQMRDAKTSTAKTASWHGMKSSALKGMSWFSDRSTNSNVDYLVRVTHNPKTQKEEHEHEHHDEHAEEEEDDLVDEEDTTENTDKHKFVEELVLVYPPSTGLDPDQMRAEFVHTMLRAKSKAQRDAIISSALLPVTYGIDVLGIVFVVPAIFMLPAGAVSKMDTMWAINSIRAARTARKVTKRLSSTVSNDGEGMIRLNFVPSEGVHVMGAYLLAECQRRNPKLFPAPYYEGAVTEEYVNPKLSPASYEGAVTEDLNPKFFPASYEEAVSEDFNRKLGLASYEGAVTEADVLRALLWRPSESAHTWEDEQWECTDARLDLKTMVKKGAKEWVRWCKFFQRSPVRAARH